MYGRVAGSSLAFMVKNKQSTCLWCKKVFYHTDAHAYKGCCTWGCLCRLREQGAVIEEQKIKQRTEDQIIARIRTCMKKIEKYEQDFAKKEVGSQPWKQARYMVWLWKNNLKKAEQELSDLRDGDANKEDCGIA